VKRCVCVKQTKKAEEDKRIAAHTTNLGEKNPGLFRKKPRFVRGGPGNLVGDV